MRKIIYTCGAIDLVTKEEASGWREKVEEWASDEGITIINPVKTELYGLLHDQRHIRTFIIKPDIQLLLDSDAVIARICSNSGNGTLAELAVALWANIPVYYYLPTDEDSFARIPDLVDRTYSHTLIGKGRRFWYRSLEDVAAAAFRRVREDSKEEAKEAEEEEEVCQGQEAESTTATVTQRGCPHCGGD